MIFIKKIISISFIICFILLQIGFTKETKIPNNFTEEIKNYQSYNETKLELYYNEYTKHNNIIYALNKINHPNFLTSSNITPSIKFNNSYLVNSCFYLDEDYIPFSLIPVTNNKILRKGENMLVDKTTSQMYNKLYLDSIKEDLDLIIYSAYRSFEKQNDIYNKTIDKLYVAKAGHSEHQTGCALDIATLASGLSTHFESTLEFNFLKNNAHKYGFILRYPKNKEIITGFPYEPWHYRYVGIDIATKIYEEKLTLEEYVYQFVELK